MPKPRQERQWTRVAFAIPNDLLALADQLATKEYRTRTSVLRAWLMLGAPSILPPTAKAE